MMASLLQRLATRPGAAGAAARRPVARDAVRRGDAAAREPDEGDVPARPPVDRARRRAGSGRDHADDHAGRDQPRRAALRQRRRPATSTAPTPATTWRSDAASTRARARRSRATEARVSLNRLLDRLGDIRLVGGASTVRRARPQYHYNPSFMLRGLQALHLEFTATLRSRRRHVMGLLDGKVAVITGAGSGMAKASTKLFVAEGAKAVAADISGAEKDTAAEIGERCAARALRRDAGGRRRCAVRGRGRGVRQGRRDPERRRHRRCRCRCTSSTWRPTTR